MIPEPNTVKSIESDKQDTCSWNKEENIVLRTIMNSLNRWNWLFAFVLRLRLYSKNYLQNVHLKIMIFISWYPPCSYWRLAIGFHLTLRITFDILTRLWRPFLDLHVDQCQHYGSERGPNFVLPPPRFPQDLSETKKKKKNPTKNCNNFFLFTKWSN